MVILNEYEVIPFQKYPRYSLCKKLNFVKDNPFSKPNLKTTFSIKHCSTIISEETVKVANTVILLQLT